MDETLSRASRIVTIQSTPVPLLDCILTLSVLNHWQETKRQERLRRLEEEWSRVRELCKQMNRQEEEQEEKLSRLRGEKVPIWTKDSTTVQVWCIDTCSMTCLHTHSPQLFNIAYRKAGEEVCDITHMIRRVDSRYSVESIYSAILQNSPYYSNVQIILL